jgi:hypothetical protein
LIKFMTLEKTVIYTVILGYWLLIDGTDFF